MCSIWKRKMSRRCFKALHRNYVNFPYKMFLMRDFFHVMKILLFCATERLVKHPLRTVTRHLLGRISQASDRTGMWAITPPNKLSKEKKNSAEIQWNSSQVPLVTWFKFSYVKILIIDLRTMMNCLCAQREAEQEGQHLRWLMVKVWPPVEHTQIHMC